MKTMVPGYIEADDDPTQREIQADDKKTRRFYGLEGLEIWGFGGFRVWAYF